MPADKCTLMSSMPNLPWSLSRATRWERYGLALLAVAGTSLLSFGAGEWVSEDNDMLFYLSCAIFTALYLGRGPGRLAACLSLLVLNVARIHPGFRVGFQGWQYLLSFAFFLILSDQIGRLADQVRREAWLARCREYQADVLARFAAAASQCAASVEVGPLLEKFSAETLGVEIKLDAGQPTPWLPRKQREFTETGLHEDLSDMAAHTLERLESAERLHRSQLLEATQKLQSTLLHSISHDLQTPLSSVLGTIEVLADPKALLPPEDRTALLELAREQTLGLQRLVKNVLNLCKLEGGALQLTVGWVPLEEVLSSALAAMPAESRARIQIKNQPDPLPEVRGDFMLLVQVVSNLLDNALKFSPSSSPVQVVGQGYPDRVTLQIVDHGCGVREEERSRIFERFYRGQTPMKTPGSGLGLHICQAIVELHGGQLEALPATSGCCMQVTIPVTYPEGGRSGDTSR